MRGKEGKTKGKTDYKEEEEREAAERGRMDRTDGKRQPEKRGMAKDRGKGKKEHGR